MLANLNKDCTTKQLITSLRNFYPILNEYYPFVYNDDDDFEVMVTITSITQNLVSNKPPPSSSNSDTTIINDKDQAKHLDVEVIVDKTVDVSVLSNRTGKTFTADDTSATNVPPLVLDDISVTDVLASTLEVRDFDAHSEDNNRCHTPEFQDFDDRDVKQPFSPSVIYLPTKNNKESWADVASLRKGLRGAITIKPTANEIIVPSPGNNNFDVLRDDDSSTRTPTKTVALLQKRITRYTSIMNVSDKVNSAVAKLIDQPYISPSQDPVQEFPPSQEIQSIKTPTVSNKTSNTVVTLDDGDIKQFHTLKGHDLTT